VSQSLPFDLNRHPYANIPHTKSILKRFTADVREYAQQTNTKVKPELIGFLKQNIEECSRVPTGSAMMTAANQLTKLSTALKELLTKDTEV
ncbi:hypothetical protein SARC_14775, partial [Sphaeroforma arctica JP610]